MRASCSAGTPGQPRAALCGSLLGGGATATSPVTEHAPFAADTTRHPRGWATCSKTGSSRAGTESPTKSSTGVSFDGGGTDVDAIDTPITDTITNGTSP